MTSAGPDLTPFGFTPTESLLYGVLLVGGPGTGYALARSAGLARANAYSALEGLVAKGAARVEEGKPRRYRPEPPATILARIMDHQGAAIEELSAQLQSIAATPSPTLVELSTYRGVLQLMAHEVARAETRVWLIAPPDSFGTLTPPLRRAAANGVELRIGVTGTPPDLSFTRVSRVVTDTVWPGEPLMMEVDRRSALLAARTGETVHGHWGTAPTLLAAATLVLDSLLSEPGG